MKLDWQRINGETKIGFEANLDYDHVSKLAYRKWVSLHQAWAKVVLSFTMSNFRGTSTKLPASGANVKHSGLLYTDALQALGPQ